MSSFGLWRRRSQAWSTPDARPASDHCKAREGENIFAEAAAREEEEAAKAAEELAAVAEAEAQAEAEAERVAAEEVKAVWAGMSAEERVVALANMSPKERAAMMANMTPEERREVNGAGSIWEGIIMVIIDAGARAHGGAEARTRKPSFLGASANGDTLREPRVHQGMSC